MDFYNKGVAVGTSVDFLVKLNFILVLVRKCDISIIASFFCGYLSILKHLNQAAF